jgi:hypothetical protein
MHGGTHKRGLEHHAVKTGRYSKSMPTKLAANYEASLKDREQLSLKPEIALVDAKLNQLLERIPEAESGAGWKAIKNHIVDLRGELAEGKVVQVAVRLDKMEALTLDAINEEATWQDIRQAVHDRRLLAESERKRAVEAQQILTAEQALTLMGVIESIIVKHVTDYDARIAIATELERLAYIPEHEPAHNGWVDEGNP